MTNLESSKHMLKGIRIGEQASLHIELINVVHDFSIM